MKKVIWRVVAALAVYGIGAFIAWELDPGAWTVEGRLMCALVAGMAAFMPWAGDVM